MAQRINKRGSLVQSVSLAVSSEPDSRSASMPAVEAYTGLPYLPTGGSGVVLVICQRATERGKAYKARTLYVASRFGGYIVRDSNGKPLRLGKRGSLAIRLSREACVAYVAESATLDVPDDGYIIRRAHKNVRRGRGVRPVPTGQESGSAGQLLVSLESARASVTSI